MSEKHKTKKTIIAESLAASNTGFLAGQTGALASAEDAAVTDATINSMQQFFDMVHRVKNKEDRYRAGHLFEAIIAYKENTDAARKSSEIKTYITHLEKSNRAPADLERRIGEEVVSEAQAKFTAAIGSGGTNRVVEEIAGTKYASMDIYVPAERLEKVREGLLSRAEYAADPAEKARYLDAARRLVEHDTDAREILFASKYPSTYAAQQEAIAVGQEMFFSTTAAAVSAAFVGGAISIVKNVYLTSKGKMTRTEAALAVARDTSKSTGRGATTGGLGTAIRYVSAKAGSKSLSKSNVATALAAATIDTGATVLAYARGEIDTVAAMERIGQNGTSTMSSIYVGAAAGAVFGPVGAIAGSVAGYLVASSLYSSTLALLRSGKLATEEAERVEYLCAAAAAQIHAETAELERLVDEQLAEQKQKFETLFARLRVVKQTGDCESIILTISDLACSLGIVLKFVKFSEFESFMNDGVEPLIL